MHIQELQPTVSRDIVQIAMCKSDEKRKRNEDATFLCQGVKKLWDTQIHLPNITSLTFYGTATNMATFSELNTGW